MFLLFVALVLLFLAVVCLLRCFLRFLTLTSLPHNCTSSRLLCLLDHVVPYESRFTTLHGFYFKCLCFARGCGGCGVAVLFVVVVGGCAFVL